MNNKEIMQALLEGKTLQDTTKEFEAVLINDNLKIFHKEKETNFFLNQAVLFTHSWKIKRETININGFEVPVPEKNPLEKNTPYYIPCLTSSLFHMQNFWREESLDYNCLKRNLIHLDGGSAIIHTKALLSLMQ